MNRLLRAGIACLCVAASAHAGEIIPFYRGAVLPAEVLTQSTTKAVIAEFLDPHQAGLGKEVSYLFWREILTAISDQQGAGVIIARAPAEERLTDMLSSEYHDAAVRIARSQRARMAIWGAVDEQDGRIVIESYLSLIDDAKNGELQLQWRFGNVSVLSAGITRTRFNFPATATTRARLFSRHLVTRAATPLRAGPGSGATLATLPAGTVLRSEGMLENWFQVRTADGAAGYVPLHQIDLPPPLAYAAAGEALRIGPDPASPRSALTPAAAEYPVTDMRYRPASGLWFRIATPAGEGWIGAARTKPRYSLPAIHFVAGLYRYFVGRWADAEREFGQYLSAPGVAADNASLATAYQLLGASRIMRASAGKSSLDNAGWREAFDKAIAIAPYDPAGYNLRAASSIIATQKLGEASKDLQQALELQPDDRYARAMVAKTAVLPEELRKLKGPSYVMRTAESDETLKGLQRRYRIGVQQ